MAWIMAAFSGAIMAVQGTLNSLLGKRVGPWPATFLVLASATILVFFVLLLMGRKAPVPWFSAPWHLYLGGPLMVLIIFLVLWTIPRLGVAPTTVAIVVAQVATALLIDHQGLFEVPRRPLVLSQAGGVLLLALGVYLLLRDGGNR